MATANTATCCAVGLSSGLNSNESTTAMGSHRSTTTTFVPANQPRS